jgi:hypothetical protein
MPSRKELFRGANPQVVTEIPFGFLGGCEFTPLLDKEQEEAPCVGMPYQIVTFSAAPSTSIDSFFKRIICSNYSMQLGRPLWWI